MAPFGSDDKHVLTEESTESSSSSELKEVKCNMADKMAAGAATMDRAETSGSQATLHSCPCGPKCNGEKCTALEKPTLIGWDNLRTKILIGLIALLVLWLVIYIPISLTIL